MHEEKIIMIDSIMKYHEPKMMAPRVTPALSSSLLSIDTNEQNNHFFAPFAYFAVKNSKNRSKPALELQPNIFNDIKKVKRE